MICAVLAKGHEIEAYVRVPLHVGAVPLRITYCNVTYRYTFERTAGGWRVYQRVA